MKIASPNDTDPNCVEQSGVTYGVANRYATSNGAEGSKQVDTFDGTTGGADELNTNTSCATLQMNPNTFGSTYSDITVYTNSPNGYAVSLQAAEPNLVNTADSTQYIPAGTLTETNGNVPGDQNKWAYKTNNGIITNWTAATTTDTTIKSYDSETSGGDTTRVTYGVSAGNNPAGKYATTLTYTATMFDDSNPYVGNIDTDTVANLAISPTTLKIARNQQKTLTVTPAEGYYLSGVTCPTGYNCSGYTTDRDDPASAAAQNITIKNQSASSATANIGLTVAKLAPEFFTISTMQEMTSSVCNSVPTPSASATTSMTIANYDPNLLIEGGSYVAEATLRDVRDTNSYTVRKLADGNCWMTDNLNIAGGTTLTADTSNIEHNYTLPASTSPASFNTNNVEHVYNYTNKLSFYTQCAATAGCHNGASPVDICPKNWQLPNNSGLKSWENLLSVNGAGYKILSDNGATINSEILFNKPFSIDRLHGQVWNGLISVGQWSVYYTNYGVNGSGCQISIGEDKVYYSYCDDNGDGHALRCVAK